MVRVSFALDAYKARLGLVFMCIEIKLSTGLVKRSTCRSRFQLCALAAMVVATVTSRTIESHLLVTISVSRRTAGQRLNLCNQCAGILTIKYRSDHTDGRPGYHMAGVRKAEGPKKPLQQNIFYTYTALKSDEFERVRAH
jgi:hypothetical protein